MKTTNISQFKAHISQELRAVRAGERIVIMDRDIPVAEVVPYRATAPELAVRLPVGELAFRDLKIRVERDPVELLMEERGKR
ncbi:MAG: type II toxin-antitoxin system Phd/YefM family antitoxin [Spirochaetales bacterium]|nr:type II toxin-antitoxin system Phd/YefM family antitoxin [Spirochaetales bacterium]